MDGLNARSPALDVLRGVAALGVVFGHAGILASAAHVQSTGAMGFVAQNGWKGIYLFFAISGYLIARPFVRAAVGIRPAVGIRDYARRRAARILPAHWVALTAMVLLLSLDRGAIPQDATPGRYLAHMLLVQNLIPGVSNTILPVTWTLGIEAIFYVTVPLAFRLAMRSGRRTADWHLLSVLAGLWLAGGAVFYLGGTQTPPTLMSVVVDNVLTPTIGYLFFFIPGIVIAVLEARRDRGLPSRLMEAGARAPLYWLALAVTIWVLAGELLPYATTFPPVTALIFVLNASFGFAAVLAVVTGLRDRRWPALAVALGEASYGLYLWHWIVLNVMFWLGASMGLPNAVWGNQAVDWLAAVAITFPIAWFSWVAIERPAMRWARTRSHVMEAQLQSAVTA